MRVCPRVYRCMCARKLTRTHIPKHKACLHILFIPHCFLYFVPLFVFLFSKLFLLHLFIFSLFSSLSNSLHNHPLSFLSQRPDTTPISINFPPPLPPLLLTSLSISVPVAFPTRIRPTFSLHFSYYFVTSPTLYFFLRLRSAFRPLPLHHPPFHLQGHYEQKTIHANKPSFRDVAHLSQRRS